MFFFKPKYTFKITYSLLFYSRQGQMTTYIDATTEGKAIRKLINENKYYGPVNIISLEKRLNKE